MGRGYEMSLGLRSFHVWENKLELTWYGHRGEFQWRSPTSIVREIRRYLVLILSILSKSGSQCCKMKRAMGMTVEYWTTGYVAGGV